jgi:hypothetical protein
MKKIYVGMSVDLIHPRKDLGIIKNFNDYGIDDTKMKKIILPIENEPRGKNSLVSIFDS